MFHRRVAALYCVALLLVAALNYLPGVPRPEGRVFGIFALDAYDDALHLASGIWAGVAAWWSARASRTFLLVFGAAYLLDGLMGLAVGSGFLDLGILTWGVLDLPLSFKALANAPHLLLGTGALIGGLRR